MGHVTSKEDPHYQRPAFVANNEINHLIKGCYIGQYIALDPLQVILDTIFPVNHLTAEKTALANKSLGW